MQAVRDSGDMAPTVTVNIDTLTFDRVLIFLEAYALKRKPPRFAVHLLGDLQEVRLVCCTLHSWTMQPIGSLPLPLLTHADQGSFS